MVRRACSVFRSFFFPEAAVSRILTDMPYFTVQSDGYSHFIPSFLLCSFFFVSVLLGEALSVRSRTVVSELYREQHSAGLLLLLMVPLGASLSTANDRDGGERDNGGTGLQ